MSSNKHWIGHDFRINDRMNDIFSSSFRTKYFFLTNYDSEFKCRWFDNCILKCFLNWNDHFLDVIQGEQSGVIFIRMNIVMIITENSTFYSIFFSQLPVSILFLNSILINQSSKRPKIRRKISHQNVQKIQKYNRFEINLESIV